MIQATIYKKPEGQYKGFQVLGHADSVETGADLVCCAVSTLTINLVNSLEAFADDDFDLISNEELGLIQVTFKSKISNQAITLMKSYELGMTNLLLEYDDWLRVFIKEV